MAEPTGRYVVITWHTKNGRGFRMIGDYGDYRGYGNYCRWSLVRCPQFAAIFCLLDQAKRAVEEYLSLRRIPKGWGPFQIWEVKPLQLLRESSSAFDLVQRHPYDPKIPCPAS